MKKNENTPPSESITPEELISRLKANLFSAEAKSASEKDGRAAENDEDGNIAETAFEEIDDNSVLITDAQDKEKTEIDKDASSESRADSDAAGTIELFESEDLLDEDEIAQSDIRQGAFSVENFEKDEMENDALQESIFNLDFPEDESVSDNGELESVRGIISDFISRYSKDEEKAEVKAPAENKEDTKPENKESAKPDSKENTKPAASKVYRFNRVPSLKDKNKIEVRSDVDLVNELTRADYEQHKCLDPEEPDIDMMLAFGVPLEQVIETYGEEVGRQYEEEAKKTGTDIRIIRDYEYTDKCQNDEIKAFYGKSLIKSKIKILVASVFTLLLLIFENIGVFGGNLGGALNSTVYPVVYIMAGLQLLVFTAALIFDDLAEGLEKLLTGTPSIYGIAAVSLITTVLCDIILCFTEGEIKLYNFAMALLILMLIIARDFELRRQFYAFKLISSSNDKFCAKAIEGDRAACEIKAFEADLDRGSVPSLVKIIKANFVNNLFTRSNETRVSPADKVLTPLAIACAVLFAVITYITKDSLPAAVGGANIAMLLILPVSVFFAGNLPRIKAAEKAKTLNSAIIGEMAEEEYSGISVITIEDKDVFPSYCVNVKALKIYGEHEISNVLYNTASLFMKLGGPLSDVYELMTKEIGVSQNVEIIKTDYNGITANVDGVKVIAGKADFMQSNSVIPIFDAEDRAQLRSSDISIMYIAIDGELAGKFYIQYLIHPDFEYMLKQLDKEEICTAIRTNDPNIDDKILSGGKIKLSKYAVKIVKSPDFEEVGVSVKEADSGIVSVGSTNEILQTILMCDKLSSLAKTNNLLKVASAVAGIIIMTFGALFAEKVGMYSFVIALYQLVWVIPAAVLSKLFFS